MFDEVGEKFFDFFDGVVVAFGARVESDAEVSDGLGASGEFFQKRHWRKGFEPRRGQEAKVFWVCWV